MSFVEGGFSDTPHTTILPLPLDQVHIYIDVHIHTTPLPACHLQEDVTWSLQHPGKDAAADEPAQSVPGGWGLGVGRAVFCFILWPAVIPKMSTVQLHLSS